MLGVQHWKSIRNYLVFVVGVSFFFSMQYNYVQANELSGNNNKRNGLIMFLALKIKSIQHKKMKVDREFPEKCSDLRVENIDVELVKRYAPILYFHPNEGKQCCYPSCAEEAYPRARQGKTGKLKFPNILLPNTPCYYDALYTDSGYRIKYWFWYNYNDYPTGPDFFGSHPGDWEYIEVYFENDKPVLYVFSNHTTVRTREVHEVSLQGSQVRVWVGEGSHANYESSNPEKIWSVLGFPDKVAEGGSVWNTTENLVDVKNTLFCHDKYLGDWGDGKKIYGPLSRMNN